MKALARTAGDVSLPVAVQRAGAAMASHQLPLTRPMIKKEYSDYSPGVCFTWWSKITTHPRIGAALPFHEDDDADKRELITAF